MRATSGDKESIKEGFQNYGLSLQRTLQSDIFITTAFFYQSDRALSSLLILPRVLPAYHFFIISRGHYFIDYSGDEDYNA
jgi:hypothetical protein